MRVCCMTFKNGIILVFAFLCNANCFSHLKIYHEYSSRPEDVALTHSSK